MAREEQKNKFDYNHQNYSHRIFKVVFTIIIKIGNGTLENYYNLYTFNLIF